MSDKNLRIKYTWLIKDIEPFIQSKPGKRWPSPIFMGENDKSTWQLELAVETKGNIKFSWISIKSCNMTIIPSEQRITFSLINPEFDGRAISRSIKTLPDDGHSAGVFLCDMDYFRYYVFKGTIVIECEVLGPEERSKKSIYEPLMNNETLSDVKILVANETFAAHKVVLSANSPVFRKMFTHAMQESIANHVLIKEIDAEVFEELLRYMYTGKVNNFKDRAQEILVAANRYGMEDLKLMCEQVLCKKLELENVTEFLKVADNHNASTLKQYCFALIMKNYEAFVKLDGLKELQKANGNMLVELGVIISSEYKLQLKDDFM